MLEIEIEKLPSYGIGLERGAAAGARANAESLLRRLIASRFGVVDDAATEKMAGASTEQLNAWAERVLSADSVNAVFTDADPA
jgi:hypothetical protein